MPSSSEERPLVLAFYLPQYHPVPENDAWWGRGFTEWTNVVQARPLFEGHYQPHLPADLGFYDLRLPEVREHQAAMAAVHGIDGFCYYHYWFGGRRLLDRTFDEVRRSGRPRLPFALCWVNENWTRSWDAGHHQVLMEQSYGTAEDRAAHIDYLVDAFTDDRYLRVDDRPLFSIYRISALPDPDGFTADLRRAAVAAGVGDPFIIKFDAHGDFDDPADTGCDAAAQFFPHGIAEMKLDEGAIPVGDSGNMVLPYEDVAGTLLQQPEPAWPRFECVIPGWDNTSRRGDGRSLVVHGATPEAYERWLRAVVERAPKRTRGRPLVFLNAWNEWAEGAHLEPDQRWGDAFLRATARVLLGAEPPRSISDLPPPHDVPPATDFEDLYTVLYDRYVDLQRHASALDLAAQRRLDHAVGPLAAQLREEQELSTRLADQLSRRLDAC